MADARHAFGDSDELLGMPVCVEVGSRGPCSEKRVVRIAELGRLVCSTVADDAAERQMILAPPARVHQCKTGGFRSLYNLCKQFI